MKKKLLGIFVCMFLIVATTLPVAGTIENRKMVMEHNRLNVIIQPPEEWDRTFGGIEWDVGRSVQQTKDGGYIVTGLTCSYGAGYSDVWLIKTDEKGSMEWDKTFGGKDGDGGLSVLQTNDGGYIIAGYTTLNEAWDVWLIKTDSNGNEQWSNTFGGKDYEKGMSIQETNDGGYIVTGDTSSYGDGNSDIWLIKTDSGGNEEWNRTYGGVGADSGFSVQQTIDEGYIITGYMESLIGTFDVCLIKTDENGSMEWDKIFGGMNNDVGGSVQQTKDEGYIIAGKTCSYSSGSDIWLIKTDSDGKEEWNKTFGETGKNDEGSSVQQTTDNGYIVTGYTMSYGAVSSDVWLIKTDSDGKEEWNKKFGGADNDDGASVQQTSDGGYIITGYTMSFGAGSGDIWLVKVAGENHAPEAPIIDGPPRGKVGVEYKYNFSLSDPESDSMYLRVDWGSGTPGSWQGPFTSGTTVKFNHSWNKKGNYTIRAQAKDIHGAESGWGELEITIPKNKPFNFNFPLLNWLFEQFPILQKILDVLRLNIG